MTPLLLDRLARFPRTALQLLRKNTRGLLPLAIAACSLGSSVSQGHAALRRVPKDYPTIQAAINAAVSGDLVLVARGTYAGGLVISGKSITLASAYTNTRDPNDVAQTIVTGGDPLIRIDASAANTTVQGLSFQMGGYGLVNKAPNTKILDSRFIHTQDAVSFDRAGGVCSGNYIDDAADDGIDIDYPNFDITIENNTIVNSRNDGIEIRALPYTGPMATVLIRNNDISGSVEDGIQLIDYSGRSSHIFRIERNVIANNAMAGFGIMANANTDENLVGAPMVEEVRVVNNTFTGNPYGITGGDNMLVLNNVIVNSNQVGLKRASSSSLARNNLFWNNRTNYITSNVNAASTLLTDPQLRSNYDLQPSSPCIDAGAASIVWNGATVHAPSYNGPAPDLGAKETPLGSSVGRAGGLSVRMSLDGLHLDLSWSPGCADATDYGVYEGFVGDWYSHKSVQCSTGGSTSATLLPGSGDRYILVVPNNATYEGSYGADSNNIERPAGASGCRSFQSRSCP